MSQGARVLRPDREQLRWDMVDLDSQLPPDHRARIVWAFVAGLDLAAFYERIQARDAIAGRPASDPAVLLAVWLYAIVDGIGAARAIARLCDHHAAYRWLCGGVPVNHDMLSEFRRSSGDVLDRLLTQSLVGLIDEGLVALAEVAIDGTKVAARAGRGSMAGRERLRRIEQQVAQRVARLKAELDHDAAAAERRRRDRALRAAEEQAARVRRAQDRLGERAAEQAERAKKHARAEAAKAAPQVSVSDPEARLMRLADGATRTAPRGRRGTCRWPPPAVSWWRSSRPSGATTAAWRRRCWRRSNAAAVRRRRGCWPTAGPQFARELGTRARR